MDETPRGLKICPACEGDGLFCDSCGEIWGECDCFDDDEDGPDYHECEACCGTGRVPEVKRC